MKLTPEEILISEKMQPGVLNPDGFLGQDDRHFHEIIQTDTEYLQSVNYTVEQIVEKMRYFTELSKEAYDGPELFDGHFEIQQDIWRGRVVCPFNHRGTYPKATIILKNLNNGIVVKWTPLNIHMIEDHGFFEGIGSKYRIEPGDLTKALFE